jgi:ubiquinone/menaquinone biosynthesis C-methylase UbiE
MMAVPQKAYKGIPMEGVIATWYTKNTKGDTSRFMTAALAVAERVPPGGRVLEVAPGPGYLAIEIARSGRYHVTGLDISQSFVRIAAENAREADVAVDFRHGNASHMPFAAASFDYVVCMAAFKNFADPIGALNEIHRVLKPGGRASIYDLRKDASRDAIDKGVGDMHLSTLNAAMTRWVFRFWLLKKAYSRQAIEQLAELSRFGSCDIETDGIGFELRLSKS